MQTVIIGSLLMAAEYYVTMDKISPDRSPLIHYQAISFHHYLSMLKIGYGLAAYLRFPISRIGSHLVLSHFLKKAMMTH